MKGNLGFMKIISVSCQNRFISLCILWSALSCFRVVAQEYKYEIGGGLGMSMYMGDANKNNFFTGWQPAGGIVWRKNANLRWAIKADLMAGKVRGDTRKGANVFPGELETSFDHWFYELGGEIEFNFLPYSDKYAYLQTSRMAPYLLAGVGLTYASTDQSFFGLNVPLGIGVKYKMTDRVNVGMEYSFRKLFGDRFDSPELNNPYNINSGLLKNKDWYAVFWFSITWSFGPNDRACTNWD